MKTGRRYFISSFAVVLTGAKSLFAQPQRQQGGVRIPPVVDGNASGRSPDDEPPLPPPDPRERLKESQKNLRRDADRLLELAKDLKEEVDKTEQTDVLSLSLVKKAEEVEKLAHQIKDRIRES